MSIGYEIRPEDQVAAANLAAQQVSPEALRDTMTGLVTDAVAYCHEVEPRRGYSHPWEGDRSLHTAKYPGDVDMQVIREDGTTTTKVWFGGSSVIDQKRSGGRVQFSTIERKGQETVYGVSYQTPQGSPWPTTNYSWTRSQPLTGGAAGGESTRIERDEHVSSAQARAERTRAVIDERQPHLEKARAKKQEQLERAARGGGFLGLRGMFRS